MTRGGKRAPPLEYPKGQTDLVARLVPHCPTCGGEWKGAKRVCRRCGQPISGGHKWRLIPAGPGIWAIEHRNCEHPHEREGFKGGDHAKK